MAQQPVAAAAPQRRAARLTSVSADLMRQPRRTLTLVNLLLVAGFVSAIVWADRATLEEVTSGTGRVIPAGKTQFIQYLEGGIVKDILVRDGDLVEKDQIIFRIDPTTVGSSLDERIERLAALRATVIRLQAEIADTKLEFPADLEAARPGIVERERRLYTARRAELEASLSVLRQVLTQKEQEIAEIKSRIEFTARFVELTQEEMQFTEPLVRQRLASQVDYIKLKTRLVGYEADLARARIELPKAEAARSETLKRIDERTQSYRAQSLKDLTENENNFAALTQSIKADQDRVNRTEVRAPVRGVVKEVKVTTIGQVVRPGSDLAEIVPLEGALLVEADVRPSDIAFLRPDQNATVKITAYDFTVYGTLAGRVEQISADTIKDEKGNPFYKIRVRTTEKSLQAAGRELPIIPGMIVQVDILTGQKTVLQYLLKPLRRIADQGMRER